MKTSLRKHPVMFLLVLALSCPTAFGQHGAVTFKHFKSHPPGQWEQTIQATRDGAPVGPPQTAMLCASPLTAAQHASVTQTGNAAAPMCSMTILKDEERVAEYQQVCQIGPQEQIIHSTMQTIDDKTMSTEIRQSIGGHETSLTKITSRYKGPCTADKTAPTMAAMPSLPTLSKEECAGVPEMKKQATDGAKSCVAEDMPETARAACVAAMQRLAGTVQMMESQCR